MGAEVEVVAIRTSGDRLAQVALADFGGKALFVKEIEEALLEGRIDVAVHSLKDMPAELPPGLGLAAFSAREDPRDVLVTRRPGGSAGCRRARSWARRASGGRRCCSRGGPTSRPEPIRGNVDTRLEKLERGEYDGVILAAAGLRRLGLAPPHATPLDPDEFVPAVGQGILAVEAREADRRRLNFWIAWTTLNRGWRRERSERCCAGSAPAATRRWPGSRAWRRARSA